MAEGSHEFLAQLLVDGAAIAAADIDVVTLRLTSPGGVSVDVEAAAFVSAPDYPADGGWYLAPIPPTVFRFEGTWSRQWTITLVAANTAYVFPPEKFFVLPRLPGPPPTS